MAFNKTIAILQLFTPESTVWTPEEIARAIGVSTSTAYRHVKELCSAGFLDAVVRGGYAIGPAFIQYDYLLRQNDSLIRVATPVMKDLLESVDPRVDVVLSRLFNDRVLCIHQENGTQPHPPTTYARGVAMPLFTGATAKAILAHLPDRRLRQIYLDNEHKIEPSTSAAGWKSFREKLRRIRKEGVSVTISEVQQGRVGLAAPIFRNSAVVGSLSMVMEEDVFAESSARLSLASRVKAAAGDISHRLSDDAMRPDRAP